MGVFDHFRYVGVAGETMFTSLLMTFAFNISKNHRCGIDIGKTIIILFLVLIFIRFFFLLTGLLFSELLYKDSALPSGMLGIDEISLFILLDVNVTW